MTALAGKVALVTGASRGIGAAVARALAAEGVRIALASRSGDDLGLGGAVARPCDVRRPEDLEALAAEAVERFGGIDILVANAGVGAYGPFLELPADQLEEMIDVNVKGTLYAVRRRFRTCSRATQRTSSRSLPRRAAAAFPSKLSTAPRSSPRSASHAPSTMSCASRVSAARTCARAASPQTSRWAAAARPTCRRSQG